MVTRTDADSEALLPFRKLVAQLDGDVQADRLTRTLYSTDASIYEILPDVVVTPRHADDVIATARFAAEQGMSVTPRGGGTGLTGGAVNRGIILDCSRYLNRAEVNPEARTAWVEPGVVLDELNAALKRHGLYYAPDVSTSSRATLGGMLGNNSCGAHSVRTGRTCDHLRALEIVLGDGSLATFGNGDRIDGNPRAVAAADRVRAECDAHAALIEQRYPKVLRCNGGYALDRARGRQRASGPAVEQLLCGSEGTLGLITGAEIELLPLPACKGLVVAHFDNLLDSMRAVPGLLEHEPAAIELIDKLILDATRENPAYRVRRSFVKGDPEALLVVELYGDSASDLERQLARVVAQLRDRGVGYAWPTLIEPARQADVWEVRKAGLGLLMSKPGPKQPHAFIEDAAVPPEHLASYIEGVARILDEEGCAQAGYYGHASVGCIHVRPVLSLKDAGDLRRLREIAQRVCDLSVDFGGSMTGEHGDGLVRSEWLERVYGAEITAAFGRIKHAFDPERRLNPGKIVDPQPMDAKLRYDADFKHQVPLTVLDFSKHGGMAGLAEMCSGVGQCRQRLVGTMCPSFMATNDERHTTRARANALRAALGNRAHLDGLDDPALDEAFDLCLSCKACKTECPTQTDIAKLKSEWLHHRHRTHGIPLRTRLIAASVTQAPLASRMPALSNALLQSKPVRWLMDKIAGMDRRVPPPIYARETFRRWFARRGGSQVRGGERVAYFVDTWTNHFTPQVGKAAVELLEHAGCEVIVPPTVCCGRPMISKGLLDQAQGLARRNAEVLGEIHATGAAIVASEPSCLSALTDEMPELVPTAPARAVASRLEQLETFLSSRLEPIESAASGTERVIYHGHCHQKALFGTDDTLDVLRRVGLEVSSINAGCCGMAGSFGHESEHYEVAAAVGWQRLFPAVLEQKGAAVAISGFSCRHQIWHHTGIEPRHALEVAAEALRGRQSETESDNS